MGDLYRIKLPGFGEYEVEADDPSQLDSIANEIRATEGPARKAELSEQQKAAIAEAGRLAPAGVVDVGTGGPGVAGMTEQTIGADVPQEPGVMDYLFSGRPWQDLAGHVMKAGILGGEDRRFIQPSASQEQEAADIQSAINEPQVTVSPYQPVRPGVPLLAGREPAPGTEGPPMAPYALTASALPQTMREVAGEATDAEWMRTASSLYGPTVAKTVAGAGRALGNFADQMGTPGSALIILGVPVIAKAVGAAAGAALGPEYAAAAEQIARRAQDAKFALDMAKAMSTDRAREIGTAIGNNDLTGLAEGLFGFLLDAGLFKGLVKGAVEGTQENVRQLTEDRASQERTRREAQVEDAQKLAAMQAGAQARIQADTQNAQSWMGPSPKGSGWAESPTAFPPDVVFPGPGRTEAPAPAPAEAPRAPAPPVTVAPPEAPEAQPGLFPETAPPAPPVSEAPIAAAESQLQPAQTAPVPPPPNPVGAESTPLVRIDPTAPISDFMRQSMLRAGKTPESVDAYLKTNAGRMSDREARWLQENPGKTLNDLAGELQGQLQRAMAETPPPNTGVSARFDEVARDLSARVAARIDKHLQNLSLFGEEETTPTIPAGVVSRKVQMPPRPPGQPLEGTPFGMGTLLRGARNVAADFQKNGRLLLNAPVSGMGELATRCWIYRDPNIETLRIFYVVNGKVAWENAITSKSPTTVEWVPLATRQKAEAEGEKARRRASQGTANQITLEGEVEPASRGSYLTPDERARDASDQVYTDWWDDTGRKIQRAIVNLKKQYPGANIKVYTQHNHPPGDVRPSPQDVDFVERLSRYIPEQYHGGHVITDHTEYGYIAPLAFRNAIRKMASNEPVVETLPLGKSSFLPGQRKDVGWTGYAYKDWGTKSLRQMAETNMFGIPEAQRTAMLAPDALIGAANTGVLGKPRQIQTKHGENWDPRQDIANLAKDISSNGEGYVTAVFLGIPPGTPTLGRHMPVNAVVDVPVNLVLTGGGPGLRGGGGEAPIDAWLRGAIRRTGAAQVVMVYPYDPTTPERGQVQSALAGLAHMDKITSAVVGETRLKQYASERNVKKHYIESKTKSPVQLSAGQGDFFADLFGDEAADPLASLETVLGGAKPEMPKEPTPAPEKAREATKPPEPEKKPEVVPLMRQEETTQTRNVTIEGNRLKTEAEGSPTILRAPRTDLAGNQVKPKGTWAIVDALDPSVIASHFGLGRAPNPAFPPQFQERNRESSGYVENLIKRFSEKEFQPEFMGQNPVASAGAPILGRDGLVEGGNGGIMGLREMFNKRNIMYDEYAPQRERYLNFLREEMPLLGLDPTVLERMLSEGKAPALVRVREDAVPDRQEWTRLINETVNARPRADEAAVKDAGVIDDRLLQLFNTGDSGSITDPKNTDFVREFLGRLEPTRASELVADGKLTKDGIDAIQNAVFYKAYGDRNLLSKLATEPDNEIQTALKGLVSAAADFMEIRAAQDRGEIPNVDITRPITNALSKLDDLRQTKRRLGSSFSVDNYLRNLDLFGDGSVAERLMLSAFSEAGRGVNRIRSLLEGVRSAAEAHLNNRSLFENEDVQATVDGIYASAAAYSDEVNGTDFARSLTGSGEGVRPPAAGQNAGHEAERPVGADQRENAGTPAEAPASRPAEPAPAEERPAPVEEKAAVPANAEERAQKVAENTEQASLFGMGLGAIGEGPVKLPTVASIKEGARTLLDFLEDPSDAAGYRGGRTPTTPGEKAVRAHWVDPDHVKADKGFLNSVERFRMHYERASLPLEKMEEIMHLSGVPVWQRPGLMYRWAMAHDARADVMTGYGTFRWGEDGNPQMTGDSFAKVLKPAKGKLNDLRDVMASMLTDALSRQKPRKGPEQAKSQPQRELPDVIEHTEEEKRAEALRDLYGGGIWTGVPIAAAKEVLEKADPELVDTAKAISKWLGRVGDYGVDAGLANKETFDKMKNGFYFPLYRVGKTDPALFARRQGSTRKFLDPLISSIDMGRRIVKAADTNRIKTALATLADAAEAEAKATGKENPLRNVIWKEDAETTPGFGALVEEMKRAAQQEGVELPDEVAKLLAGLHDSNIRLTGKEGRFIVMRDGKPESYGVDPDVAEALGALAPVELNTFFRGLAFISRALRTGTTKNPAFAVINFPRDQADAAINTRNGFVPYTDSFVKLAQGIEDAVKERGNESNLRQLFMMSGAGYSDIASGPRIRSSKEILKEVAPKSVGGKIVYELRHPIEALNLISRPFEESTRMSEMQRSLKSGKSLIEAGDDAADITTNFRMHGTQLQALSAMVAFLNPNIQGLAKNFRQFHDRPLATSLRLASYLTLPSALLWYMGKDDQEIQDHRKSSTGKNKWFFRDPFLHRVWSMPKPFLWGSAFGTAIEDGMDAWYKHDPDAVKRWFEEVSQHLTLNSFPTMTEQNGGPWWAFLQFAPTAIQVAVGAVAGKHPAFLTPLMPESTKNLEPDLQVSPTTGQTMRRVVGAYNEKAPDWAQASPAGAEYLAAGLGGTLATQTLKLVDRIIGGERPGVSAPEMQDADIPVAGRLIPRSPSLAYEPVQKFYNDYNDVRMRHDSYNAMVKSDDPKAETYYDKHEVKIEAFQDYENVRKELSDQRKEIEAIRRAPDTEISPAEKRKQIDGIIREMIETCRELNNEKLLTPNPKQGEVTAAKRGLLGSMTPPLLEQPPD